MIRSTSLDYAVLFLIILLAWPLTLINTPLLFGVCLVINSLILLSWLRQNALKVQMCR